MNLVQMMIEVFDKFLTQDQQDGVIEYCKDCEYSYGEQDNGDTPPTGMPHNIPEDEIIYKLFASRILKAVPDLKKLNLYRMYINCFAPSENPYFHTDGDDGYTFLYYPQTEEWDKNDGGETQFYMDGNIYGITPESNRLVMFDASLVHRATAFRDKYRFTVAIKYD